MTEADHLAAEAFETGEYGPLLDWLWEHGYEYLHARISGFNAMSAYFDWPTARPHWCNTPLSDRERIARTIHLTSRD